MIKKVIITFFVIIVGIQFVRPSRNTSGEASKDVSRKYKTPENVKIILEKACADCHSNKTNYPVYAELQPLGFWINNHVNDGKRHFNYNNFLSMKPGVQKKKMEECIEQVKEGEMPLQSYTWIHKEAKLTNEEKQILYDWCQSVIDTLVATNPPDSLKLKPRKWN